MEFKVEDIIEDIDDITDTLNKYLKRDIVNSEDTITIIRDFVNTLDEQDVDEVKLFNKLQRLIDDIVIDYEEEEIEDKMTIEDNIVVYIDGECYKVHKEESGEIISIRDGIMLATKNIDVFTQVVKGEDYDDEDVKFLNITDDYGDDDDEEYYSCERCLSKNISVVYEDEIKDVAVCVCNDCGYEFENFIIYK